MVASRRTSHPCGCLTPGRGIFLHRPGDLGPDDALITDALSEHRGVACRYIDPPLLIDGIKSDVRLYVLCTSMHTH